LDVGNRGLEICSQARSVADQTVQDVHTDCRVEFLAERVPAVALEGAVGLEPPLYGTVSASFRHARDVRQVSAIEIGVSNTD
jgi:hypothetical protein